MAFVNLSGEQVYPVGGLEINDEILAATKDLIVLRLHESGATLKQIAKMFNVHEATACRWVQKIRAAKASKVEGDE